MIMDNNNFGERISQLRHDKSLTQEKLGLLLNVSAQAVSKWEKGDSLPDISLLTELANVFDCTTDYLLGRASNLQALLHQIRMELQKTTQEQKINFLGEVIAASSYIERQPASHPSLTHIQLGPTGLGLWAKDRLVCIATSLFLNEATDAMHETVEFPMNILPVNIITVLFELLLDNENLQPDFTPIEESVLRSRLPVDMDFDKVIIDCIELGFVDRVRGGYRLNVKGDIATRLFSIVHRVVSKPSGFSLEFSTTESH
ncbi:MAG: helix-turn-helix domain-containing protein [Candidatus Pristimantibacillus lignocellulolyticus]|uniref:Helix-turn-helix domain-containing protein n=1 Tax=Candidatus Pristimantibacillus lignocellulolyticus TaxID=2994561 RepID=A0A9J6ZA97_9BACL|nr:MAG: helix-turn-helix domain-containing protein [Candidatus Pristimantibacillus lignocellulolyticus]